jgi:formate dehydrogenase subunit delta
MNLEHLIRMANQIAANLAAQGEAQAIAQTAQHIQLYWDPRMKAAILAGEHEELSPIARAAVARLAP